MYTCTNEPALLRYMYFRESLCFERHLQCTCTCVNKILYVTGYIISYGYDFSWVSTRKEVLTTTERMQPPHAEAPYPDLVSVEHAKGHSTSIHKLVDSERLLLPTLTRCVDQLHCPLPGNNKVSGLVLGRE